MKKLLLGFQQYFSDARHNVSGSATPISAVFLPKKESLNQSFLFFAASSHDNFVILLRY